MNIRKYKLESLLSQYTESIKKDKINELADELDISLRQLHRYRTMSAADRGGMNTDQLQICAAFFGVSLSEFINVPENVG